VSETSEETPKRYRILAPYVQIRVRNIRELRAGTRVSPWAALGFSHGQLVPEHAHPADVEHLLKTTRPGPVGGPMLEELPAS
jgi:hypothetical protein